MYTIVLRIRTNKMESRSAGKQIGFLKMTIDMSIVLC
jgi:hypothetical protein